MASKLSIFSSEFKRRKVHHVGTVYVLVGLGVAQGAEWFFSLLEFDVLAARLVAALVLLGFPLALVLAWAYELRPEEPRPAEVLPRDEGESDALTPDGPSGGELALEEVKPAEARPAPKAVHVWRAEGGTTLAVLPFENISPDPNNDYFCYGLTEELLDALTAVPFLRVAGRTSSFAFLGSHPDTEVIRERLGVDTVLEGAVRLRGGEVRVTAHLTDLSDGLQLWAGSFDRALSDVLDLQREVAGEIAAALKADPESVPSEITTPPKIDTPVSYDAYLRGRHALYEGTLEQTREAILHFHVAVGESPEYTDAFAGLAEAWLELAQYADDHDQAEMIERARGAATHARDLDAGRASVLVAWGQIRLLGDFDWEEAESSFLRAIESNSQDIPARLRYGKLLALARRTEESLVQFEDVLERDPMNPFASTERAQVLHFAGRADEANETLLEVLREFPDFALAWGRLGAVYLAENRHEDADQAWSRFDELSHEDHAPRNIQVQLSREFLATGEPQAIPEWLETQLQRRPGQLSLYLTAAGQWGRAIEALQEAYALGSSSILYLAARPAYWALEGDPGYEELLERLRIPSKS